MKDAINCAHGYGCFCRNCDFRVTNEQGEYICKNNVLVPQLITDISFCSIGIPKQEEKKTEREIHSIEELLTAFRHKFVTNPEANEVSTKIYLKNGHSLFVSAARNTRDLKFYGIDKYDAPSTLRQYMKNSHDPHDVINEKDFLAAMAGEVKSISHRINIWDF